MKFAMFGVLIIIIIIWIYYIYLNHPNFKVVQYASIRHKFKTGDLILFHALDNLNPIFTGSYYGHIGIVYLDPDTPNAKPQIFEAFRPSGMPFYPKKFKNGISLACLKQRLNSYRGYCFYKELETPISKELQRDFRSLIDYALSNMEYRNDVVINGIEKLLFGDCLRNGTNCGELVYLSLIKLGILPENALDENRKHHLIYTSQLKQTSTNRYLTPVYVLSSYFHE